MKGFLGKKIFRHLSCNTTYENVPSLSLSRMLSFFLFGQDRTVPLPPLTAHLVLPKLLARPHSEERDVFFVVDVNTLNTVLLTTS